MRLDWMGAWIPQAKGHFWGDTHSDAFFGGNSLTTFVICVIVQDISALIKQLAGEKVEVGVVSEEEEEVEEAKPYIESDYEINTPG